MPIQRLLKAKFRGTQQEGSFKKGLNYNLSFTLEPNLSVSLITTTGHAYKISHKTMDGFFDDWTDIKPR